VLSASDAELDRDSGGERQTAVVTARDAARERLAKYAFQPAQKRSSRSQNRAKMESVNTLAV